MSGSEWKNREADRRGKTPRAAYVHVPFCRHRCGYCNFTLVAGRDDLMPEYIRAIELELAELEAPGQAPREVDTIFLGGGTPTHLPPAMLTNLLEVVRHRFALATGAEFSVEANPLDMTPERVDRLQAAGVTRISLGAQSFDADKLRVLERDHDAVAIRSAVDLARSAGFHVAIDLIFGVPGESPEMWRRDLEEAVALQPDHLSTYGLTWEKGTSFWAQRQRGILLPVPEDQEADAYEMAIDYLPSRGFAHYEVSNFAQPGCRCRHNEAYWLGDPFWAAGPGAARFVDGTRSINHRSVTTYLKRVLAGESPIAESERLSPEDAARELLVFGLRRLEGVDRNQFSMQTGFAVESLGAEALERFLEQGFLAWRDSRLALTRRGLLVSDAIWPHLLRT
ncbi:MAG: hypothetical protein RIS70_3412 [Planctomycetota bacterium]